VPFERYVSRRHRRGAARVAHCEFVTSGFPNSPPSILLVIFSKNEQANLTAAERRYFQQWVTHLRKTLKET
jgi:hypothetical protein